MTVTELIKKLQEMPKNAVVTICNDSVYVDGEYEATGIELCENKVSIVSDYEKIIEEW